MRIRQTTISPSVLRKELSSNWFAPVRNSPKLLELVLPGVMITSGGMSRRKCSLVRGNGLSPMTEGTLAATAAAVMIARVRRSRLVFILSEVFGWQKS